MPRFRTEICIKPNGIEMILAWHDEDEYWLGRAFLATLDNYPESLRKTDPITVQAPDGCRVEARLIENSRRSRRDAFTSPPPSSGPFSESSRGRARAA
jgi:hypothetical protein